MENKISIKTVSPFYAPLSVTLGIDQSSDDYHILLSSIETSSENCVEIHKFDTEQDYDSIENDARDNRILLWKSKESEILRIHLFPNNVAIAELDLVFDNNLNAKEIAAQCQERTKKQLAKIYPVFLADLKSFVTGEKSSILCLGDSSPNPVIHWISRFLLVTKEQLQQNKIQRLLKAWLKDTQNPDDANAMIKGDLDHSMTWLHYALIDAKQDGTDLRINTMVLAQYYYTAQENCNKLLKQAIDSAYNLNNRALTEKRLSFARVVTRLHLIDLHEHKKFLNRYKQKLLNKVLGSWDFDNVAKNGQRMIEICSARLEEVDNKRRERSTIMTDLLLVTLSFFTVFELSLYLTEFSREMMSRPALDYNDESRSFFLELIAEIDVDVMFSFGFGLTLALVIVYKVMKGK